MGNGFWLNSSSSTINFFKPDSKFFSADKNSENVTNTFQTALSDNMIDSSSYDNTIYQNIEWQNNSTYTLDSTEGSGALGIGPSIISYFDSKIAFSRYKSNFLS
jgi:hypothetical protein